MPIRVLPPHLANQIAAGEVIERPASVVKELIENSIDAGARHIRVDVQKGGKELIKVVDDGCGMTPEDVELSIEPHATSKIHDEQDLYAIKTLGFRGEALASIGAVSDLIIKSRPLEAPSGWMVRLSFGRDRESGPAPLPPGTVVEVRDLFLEVPARRRFLKSDKAELGHISRLIRIYASGFPEVGFTLRSGNRELFSSPKQQGEFTHMEPIFGRESLAYLMPIRGEGYGFRLRGAVSRPGHGTTGPRMCFFYLNKRPFSSKVILKAVKDAVLGEFMRNEYPLLCLYLEAPPELVDINCHPAKLEVRFRHPDHIFRLVYSAIKNAILEGASGPRRVEAVSTGHVEGGVKGALNSPRQVNKTYDTLELFEDRPASNELPEEYAVDVCGAIPRGKEGEGDSSLSSNERSRTINREVEVLGQVLDTYIVGRTQEGLFLMDQHSAHEALLFKRINQELEKKGHVSSQGLAFPILLTITGDEMERFSQVKAQLWRLGFAVDIFGEDEIAIRGVPTCLSIHNQREEIIKAIVQKAFSVPDITLETLVYDLAASVACKRAVKAGQELHGIEITTLVSECLQEGVTHCPHGRPVFIVLDSAHLKRLFRRT